MMVRIESADFETIEEARRRLTELAAGWGVQWTESRVHTRSSEAEKRSADPVALSALVLSIPATVLSVVDLADRIRSRRRAQQLIDEAKQQAGRRTTVYIQVGSELRRLDHLSPDDVLTLTDDTTPPA